MEIWRLISMEEEFNTWSVFARRDLDGNKSTVNALAGVKGVGIALSRGFMHVYEFRFKSKIGYLSDDKITELKVQ